MEVSDGFGIVFRAIELNHHTFVVIYIVIKYTALSKNDINDHKNKQRQSVEPDGYGDRIATQRRVPNANKDANALIKNLSYYLV